MVAVDTNILVYAEGLGDEERVNRARDVLLAIPRRRIVIPAQILAELYRVFSRKTSLTPERLRETLARWESFALVAPTMKTTIEPAFDLATRHRIQVFDAIILSAASETGCSLLLSEDMRDGFVWRGVTIANPFAPTPHPMLTDALRSR